MDSMNPNSKAAKEARRVAKYRGMSKEDINKEYSKMSDADKKLYGKAMAKAHQYNKKEASKAKPKPKPKPSSKPGESRYQGLGETSSHKVTGKTNATMPSNPPGQFQRSGRAKFPSKPPGQRQTRGDKISRIGYNNLIKEAKKKGDMEEVKRIRAKYRGRIITFD